MLAFDSLADLLSHLGIGKTTFYKWKKDGVITVESRLINGKRVYTLRKEASLPKYKPSSQIENWVKWREEGLAIKPWSSTYKEMQVFYLTKFFERYDTVSSSAVSEWLSSVDREQLSKRRHMHSAVSSFSKYLKYIEQLSLEEYYRIKALYPKPSPYHQREQRIIYEDDFKILMEEAGKGHSSYQRLLNQTLLVFLSETALRATEACNLRLEDLRFSENPQEAFVRVVNGKGGKSRLVPFSRKAQETIQHYLHITRNRFKQGENLFQAFNPQHGFTRLTKDCLARRFKPLSQKTGIPFSAHSLRHYRITLWANNPRIPITVVQLWAGHSSLEVTQKYIHIRDVDALKAAF